MYHDHHWHKWLEMLPRMVPIMGVRNVKKAWRKSQTLCELKNLNDYYHETANIRCAKPIFASESTYFCNT